VVSVGRAAEAAARLAVPDPARRLGVDLVAPGHPRDPVAGVQEQVECGGREPDRELDPPPEGELAGSEMRHGARL